MAASDAFYLEVKKEVDAVRSSILEGWRFMTPKLWKPPPQ